MSLIISIIFLYLTYRFLKWVFTTKPKEEPATVPPAPPVKKYHDVQEVKDFKRLEKKHETYGESYETILKGTNGFLTLTGGLVFLAMIAAFAVGLWPVGVALLFFCGVLGYIGEKKEKDLVLFADVKQHAEQIKQLPVQQYKTDKTKTNVKGNADTGANDDAHFIPSKQIGAVGLLNGAGIPLGQTLDGQPIHYKGGMHLVTVAPSGTGKHSCVQGGVLIEYDAPIIIIDPKGENAIVTAQNRRDNLGHEVHIINPFGVLDEQFKAQGFTSSRFNPLAALEPSNKNFTADISALCEALILTEGKEPFFDNSARNLIAALIMYVCVTPDEVATLPRVREILTSDKKLKGVLLDAESSDYRPLVQKAAAFIKDRKAADLGINSSVLDSARTQTVFLDDDCLSENLSGSDFRFLVLKKKKITVYIVLPAKMVFTYSRWFRLLVTASLDELMSTEEKGKKPVLFMLDEMAVLGHLSSIETAFGLSRGFGVQVWPFFQDINQLKDIYNKRANSFFSNSGIHQYFTPNDLETAKDISEKCGAVTHTANGASYGQNVSYSESEKQKPLYSAHKLRGMSENEQILFIYGSENPIKAAKVPYFRNPKYKGRFSKNPYV